MQLKKRDNKKVNDDVNRTPSLDRLLSSMFCKSSYRLPIECISLQNGEPPQCQFLILFCFFLILYMFFFTSMVVCNQPLFLTTVELGSCFHFLFLLFHFASAILTPPRVTFVLAF